MDRLISRPARAVARRLTYANVAATAALAMTLGGSSFAATVAVSRTGHTTSPGPLVGADGASLRKARFVGAQGCAPNQPCPAPATPSLLTQRVRLPTAADVAIIGTLNLRPFGQPGLSQLNVGTVVDGGAQLPTEPTPTAQTTVPIEQVVHLKAGDHRIGLGVQAQATSSPTGVEIDSGSIEVISLPALPKAAAARSTRSVRSTRDP